ncbi:hypothetical protein CBR_g26158 [Chara braunii]|uniref:DUF659 domain-containing protein n=1 Tax=Chara braunii TaxID=69332 RepID=A0A388JW40_CHABU|nr:hypothetical protein CBR_g26158 [Chara braunii]|eukprot:GBG61995.1 hypothetical protein CBR_g26158 [Chara braunii]
MDQRPGEADEAYQACMLAWSTKTKKQADDATAAAKKKAEDAEQARLLAIEQQHQHDEAAARAADEERHQRREKIFTGEQALLTMAAEWQTEAENSKLEDSTNKIALLLSHLTDLLATCITQQEEIHGLNNSLAHVQDRLQRLEQRPAAAADASSSNTSDRLNALEMDVGSLKDGVQLQQTATQQLQQRICTTANISSSEPRETAPKFDGQEIFCDSMKTNPVPWFRKFELTLQLHNVKEHKHHTYLYSRSGGACQAWLDNLLSKYGVVANDLHTKISWDDLKAAWHKRFQVEPPEIKAMDKLMVFEQGTLPSTDWIAEYQRLTSVPNIQMGFKAIRHYFISRSCYSKITAHLNKLQCEDRPFDFGEEARGSFFALKAAVLSAEVLRIYDPLLPTRVTTDASGYGIGAVLEQHDGVDWHPVEYFSKKVPIVHSIDDARKKELLAFVHTLKQWRHFLLGRSQFRWVTDNNPLVFYKTQDTINSTIARWMAFIDQIDFFPDHIPGKSNRFADALSRPPDHCTAVYSTFEIDDDLRNSFIRGYQAAPEFRDKYANCSSPNPAPSHYRIQEGYLLVHTRGKDLLCIPSDPHLHTRLLGEFHDAPATGHFGVNRTIGRLRQRFWWPGLLGDVTRYCESCEHLRTKALPTEYKAVDQDLDKIREPWDVKGLTLMTDGTTTTSNRPVINFLAVGDSGALMVRSVDMEGKDNSAPALARMWEEVIRELGLHRVNAICTDSAQVNISARKILAEHEDPAIRSIPWVSCACHVCNLLMCDIALVSWIGEVILQGREITTFIKRHERALAMFRRTQLGIKDGRPLELIQPGETRFGTNFLMLQRLRECEGVLLAMVSNPRWKPLHGIGPQRRGLDRARSSYETRLGGCLWSGQRREDGHAGVGGITLEKRIAMLSMDCETREFVMAKVKDRVRMMALPVHAAAWMLHPLHRSPRLFDDYASKEITNTLTHFASVHPKNSKEYKECWNSLKSFHHMDPEWHGKNSEKALTSEHVSVAQWWLTYGKKHPTLTKIAVEGTKFDVHELLEERVDDAAWLLDVSYRPRCVVDDDHGKSVVADDDDAEESRNSEGDDELLDARLTDIRSTRRSSGGSCSARHDDITPPVVLTSGGHSGAPSMTLSVNTGVRTRRRSSASGGVASVQGTGTLSGAQLTPHRRAVLEQIPTGHGTTGGGSADVDGDNVAVEVDVDFGGTTEHGDADIGADMDDPPPGTAEVTDAAGGDVLSTPDPGLGMGEGFTALLHHVSPIAPSDSNKDFREHLSAMSPCGSILRSRPLIGPHSLDQPHPVYS